MFLRSSPVLVAWEAEIDTEASWSSLETGVCVMQLKSSVKS